MECPIHLLVLSYSVVILASITLFWWIANIIVSWRYENYYPINYQRLQEEKIHLEDELKKYKQTFGELPQNS